MSDRIADHHSVGSCVGRSTERKSRWKPLLTADDDDDDACAAADVSSVPSMSSSDIIDVACSIAARRRCPTSWSVMSVSKFVVRIARNGMPRSKRRRSLLGHRNGHDPGDSQGAAAIYEDQHRPEDEWADLEMGCATDRGKD